MKNLLTSMLGVALLVYFAVQAAGNSNAQAPATSNASSAAEHWSAAPGTDGWITAKVKTQLLATDGLPSTGIAVATTNGVVLLSGVVDNEAQVRNSITAAEHVKGVQKVDASALLTRE